MNNAQIRSEILEEDLSLPGLLQRYPAEDPWELRLLFKSTRSEAAVKEFATRVPKIPDAVKKSLTPHALRAIEAGFLSPVELNFEVLPPAQPIFSPTGTQTLILCDLHAPEHDPRALDLALQIGRAVAPEQIILNGDMADCTALSKYVKKANQPLRWAEERPGFVEAMVKIKQAFPTTDITYKIGNHDDRPLRWIDSNAEPLQGLWTLEELLGIDSLGFHVTEEPIFLCDDRLMVKHGTLARSNAGYSATAEMLKAGMSVIMGHVHRLSRIASTKGAHARTGEVMWRGWEGGCLLNLVQPYENPEDTSNWQQGFALLTEFPNGDFDIELIPIHDGRAIFRGQLFSSRV
jgi:hypothetical protein